MSPLGDARVLCCAANPCFSANPKPRAWLRHTPYLNGKGRHEKQNPLFRRPFVCFAGLHFAVVRAAAAFGADPGDVLGGVFDVAGFAVDAVGGVDLQAGRAVFMVDLVHAGGQ